MLISLHTRASHSPFHPRCWNWCGVPSPFGSPSIDWLAARWVNILPTTRNTKMQTQTLKCTTTLFDLCIESTKCHPTWLFVKNKLRIMIFPNEIFCRLSNWNIVAHCPNNGRIEQRCNFPLIVHIFIALRTMPGHISKIPPNIRLWEQWRDINSLVLHNICTAAVAVNTLLTVDLYTITPPAEPRGKWYTLRISTTCNCHQQIIFSENIYRDKCVYVGAP